MRLPTLVFMAIFAFACEREKAFQPVVVGSKNFTESVILGELLAQKLEGAGCKVDRRLNMGGTLVADTSIASGAIDTYVEYSGTALTAILEQPIASSSEAVDRAVRNGYMKRDLRWSQSLGFNNTFAMIVRRADAEALALSKISDLGNVADRFQPGFGYEFVERPDGWTGLLKKYELQFAKPPKTMDLGLTYKALAAGQVDLIAGNSTDGLIDSLGLVALEDDRAYFPPYDAAIVYRKDIDEKCRDASRTLESLAGSLSDEEMRRLNFAVDGQKQPVKDVVARFLRKQ
jgi:glycine betaine/choline ABC-type transport system substrate-binding protein